MAPMTRNYSPGGTPADFMTDYYVRRAGVGLIVTEGIGVDHPAAIGSDGLDANAIPCLHTPEALAPASAHIRSSGAAMPPLATAPASQG